jgi:serine/threonine protein kinase
MNQTSWLAAAAVDGVPELLWEDGERRFYRIGRNGTDGTRRPYLAVLPVAEHPTPASLDRLAHEYGLRDQLDDSWALRPVEFVRDRGATVLVLEYHDGEPLDRQIARPMEIGGFLRIAVALTDAVVRLHERGLVHKDIKPTNILVEPAGDRVWLMGFGVASRLTREHQSPEPPELIAGTLAYMAPEQTGRMNRSIDARSDLYALGVTLYETLTGALPFTAADPMEWVHCHIARRPVPPGARVNHVPSPVSAIIMKLLAKTAEERYQTAAGVERDLRRCLTSWESSGRIDDFPPGEHDSPDRLLIPEHLYGRESEIDALLAAFDHVVASGTPSLVLISGDPGIGKSSVVNELHKVLVPPRGLFASGKFDQYKRDIPYSTLAQAFQGLVRPLLAKSEVDLGPWREALGEALGPNGQLMVGLVPELKLIIGEQAPVPALPPQDAQRRFQLVFRRFLSVFAKPEHPLALFVDDLQWLDAATLGLLEDLLTSSDVRHVLLIGAYRDNEVTLTHPLIHTLDVIREARGLIQEIRLAPLARESMEQLIGDSLHCDGERAGQLSTLLHEKTAGNPFFANQFLTALADEGLITFDHDAAQWSWDLTRIHLKGYTDNVVELMVGKLGRLPDSRSARFTAARVSGQQRRLCAADYGPRGFGGRAAPGSAGRTANRIRPPCRRILPIPA